MRRADDGLIDPEIAAELEAIDATLAGEPVDPRHAEVAELALLLVAGRPEIDDEFARMLDERVGRRFAPAPTAGGGMRSSRRRRGGWLLPLGGLATAAVGAVVAVAVIGGGGGSSATFTSVPNASAGGAVATSTTAASSARSPSAHSLAAEPSRTAKAANGAVSATSATTSSTAASTATLAPFSANVQGAPGPLPNGRKIIQSSELQLQTPASRIDTVAQELFDVVGRENGFVQSSNVTSGSNGYAQFQLSVPSSALSNTMTALSALRYASVVSRTDSTQDVNGEYLNDQRQLTDARALRTSLLKQLAAATTTAQIDSLTAQIHDAEASIRSDEATLGKLNHQIDYSQVSVQINAAYGPQPVHHSGTFTIGKAAHDAGRVLTVAAGVALIALAALVPVALLAAVGWWITVAARRRRREQALDLA